MNLKKLAAALAFAAMGAPAMAAIGTVDADTELFLVVWDDTVGSYTQDLGVSLNSFLANGLAGQNLSFNVGASYAAYAAADTNQNDGTASSGTRWALYAVDNQETGLPNQRLFLTTANGNNPLALTNDDLFLYSGQMQTHAGNASQTGSHGVPVASNGDSYNPLGSLGFYLDPFSTVGYYAGNNIGTSNAMYVFGNSSQDAFDPVTRRDLTSVVSFNGTTLTVTAVPEPGALGLLLAGMSALGFVGRRRFNRD